MFYPHKSILLLLIIIITVILGYNPSYKLVLSTYVNLLYSYAKAVMFESFSFSPSTVGSDLPSGVRHYWLLPVKCIYVMTDCSFSLALCTENKCFPILYYVLVGFKILEYHCQTLVNIWLKGKPKGIHWLSSCYCHYGYY